jgi:hypothetical protein
MQLGPVQNQAQSAPRQVTFNDLKPLDIDHGLLLVIFRVEVRRRVVVKEHADKNAEELTDRWHVRILYPPWQASIV